MLFHDKVIKFCEENIDKTVNVDHPGNKSTYKAKLVGYIVGEDYDNYFCVVRNNLAQLTKIHAACIVEFEFDIHRGI